MLRVASIQMISVNNDYDANREKAESLIAKAAKKKPKLILIPEFALIGYDFRDDAWKMAEALRGRTFEWLKGLARKHKTYIGTCILEKDGNDFYDTFILVGPGKDELWSHRKINPASFEAYVFKGGGISANVFETPIGRIGVSICLDSTKIATLFSLAENRPGIVLIPFSWPALTSMFMKHDRRIWVEGYLGIPQTFSSLLKVPVVTCNKTGPFESVVPCAKFMKLKSDFLACSKILDGKGNTLAALYREEGYIIADVKPAECSFSPPAGLAGEKWLIRFNSVIRLMAAFSETTGALRYRFSGKRKRAAAL